MSRLTRDTDNPNSRSIAVMLIEGVKGQGKVKGARLDYFVPAAWRSRRDPSPQGTRPTWISSESAQTSAWRSGAAFCARASFGSRQRFAGKRLHRTQIQLQIPVVMLLSFYFLDGQPVRGCQLSLFLREPEILSNRSKCEGWHWLRNLMA